MSPRPPRPTLTYILFPYTTLFRSPTGRGGSIDAGPSRSANLGARLRRQLVAPTQHDRRLRCSQALHSDPLAALAPLAVPGLWDRPRSDEHTSELQSLMRISYAVFCLKTIHHKQLKQPHAATP